MSILVTQFKNLLLSTGPKKAFETAVFVRYCLRDRPIFVTVPKPGVGKAYRRKVHFPEKYTVTPLETTHLGGRDPETGRRVVKTLGGGLKHKYHWIKWLRTGPAEGPPIQEKVLKILKCGCRTAHVALVKCQGELKYILATENMKEGDVLNTSCFIPRIPVTPNEGDAYPLGALPLGTSVHNLQLHPTVEYTIVHAAGCCAVIKRHTDGKVIVQLPSKREMSFEPECMATVGRLSNVIHSSIPIGSPQRLRELGYRPRSGLWQRKTGRFGRKIRPLPEAQSFKPKPKPPEYIRCTLPTVEI